MPASDTQAATTSHPCSGTRRLRSTIAPTASAGPTARTRAWWRPRRRARWRRARWSRRATSSRAASSGRTTKTQGRRVESLVASARSDAATAQAAIARRTRTYSVSAAPRPSTRTSQHPNTGSETITSTAITEAENTASGTLHRDGPTSILMTATSVTTTATSARSAATTWSRNCRRSRIARAVPGTGSAGSASRSTSCTELMAPPPHRFPASSHRRRPRSPSRHERTVLGHAAPRSQRAPGRFGTHSGRAPTTVHRAGDGVLRTPRSRELTIGNNRHAGVRDSVLEMMSDGRGCGARTVHGARDRARGSHVRSSAT